MVSNKFQSFQKILEPVIRSERLEKRLDRKQIDDIGFVIDRFVKAVEYRIEIFQSDRSQRFCQRSDVLPRSQPSLKSTRLTRPFSI